ncbi:MAG: ATP-binding protein [Elusimicrobiaceae bacterium]|nr:ATP-binding protein [Elusimicrobiaceae bacterium]
MIKNWEIVSRVEHKTRRMHYTLLLDGTEHDARLIAKKLRGYVRNITRAHAPYVYAFELPADMDEGTQDKIHSAVKEGVELTNKVNQFVPGGVLGEPLFNSNFTKSEKEFPTFLTLDPSASCFKGKPDLSAEQKPGLDLSFVETMDLAKTGQLPKIPQANMPENLKETGTKEKSPASTELSTTAREVFQTQPPQETLSTLDKTKNLAEEILPPPVPPQEPAQAQPAVQAPPPPKLAATPQPKTPAQVPAQPTVDDLQTQTISVEQSPTESSLSISDKDMLIKDMEGSVLEKMPLADILSAETKYDIFIEADKPVSTQVTQAQKEQKIASLQEENISTFNVFEPDVQEPSSTADVNEVQEITNRLAKKTMDFIEKPNIPPQKPSSANSHELPAEPHVQAPSQEAELPAGTLPEPQPTPAPQPSSVEISFNDKMLEDTLPPATLSTADDVNLPEITVRATPPVQQAEPNQPDSQQPASKTVLHLKKPTVPGATKTILHLRRKEKEPAAPQETVAKTLKSTMAPERMNKQKAIDHSIEIPLSELKKHNWPLEVPLVPTYTLNNMVMSVNRFAHATAISVIENPGKLYNPLVLHGGTGTGKTHFLNALAYAFSQKFGQEHIFMTNGVRLSRGIQRYVLEGNIDKFENFMQSVKALLIDDIHLLAINEQNRVFISKLLNTFIKEQKQIVITSKYPPESLEKLEELIKFKLDSGWISELKPAAGSSHFRIVKKMLIENGVDLNDDQIKQFFSGSHMTLGTITRSIRRLKVLESLIFPHLPQEKQSYAGILEKLLATKGEDQTSKVITKDPQEITSLSTVGNGEWGRIGFFYPQNCSDMMNWMVYALQQRAQELGIEGGFDIVVRSSYATENIISSAFKIANLCDNKKLKGAVILGPKPNTCDPSVRENFYDILTHMLEIMLIRCGIINYEDVRLPSTYVKIISELMR